MAYDEVVTAITRPAKVDLRAKQFYFGTLLNTSGEAQVGLGIDGADCDGVIYEGGNTGDATKLAIGGVLKVISAGSITAGNYVGSDLNGKAIVAATGDKILGKAITSASAGDIFPILWKPGVLA